MGLVGGHYISTSNYKPQFGVECEQCLKLSMNSSTKTTSAKAGWSSNQTQEHKVETIGAEGLLHSLFGNLAHEPELGLLLEAGALASWSQGYRLY